MIPMVSNPATAIFKTKISVICITRVSQVGPSSEKLRQKIEAKIPLTLFNSPLIYIYPNVTYFHLFPPKLLANLNNVHTKCSGSCQKRKGEKAIREEQGN